MYGAVRDDLRARLAGLENAVEMNFGAAVDDAVGWSEQEAAHAPVA